jgi:hypothetical protein
MSRFARLLAGVAFVTASGSLLLGTLLRAAPLRSLSVGFYGVGALLVLVGLSHFTRGRPRTPAEHRDSLASSVLFVVLGLILVMLGTVLDRRYPLA